MHTIAIVSFKGGTAKTSTCLHLGAALALYHKKRVLLVDFDAQANLTSGLGFDPDEYESMAQVLRGKRNLSQITLQTSVKGLDLVPADTWLERVEVTEELASDRYSHEKLGQILQEVDYDYVLIDTPPSLCWLTESALIAASHSLVCTTTEFYSVKGLERLSLFIDTIGKRHPLQNLGVSISFWNPRGKNNEAFLGVIASTFPKGLFKQRIRKDASVTEAAIRGEPLFVTRPKARAAEDYRHVCKELLQRVKESTPCPA